MKSEKFIIQPGKICTYDYSNVHKQDELNSINRVLVTEVVRKSIFKPRIVRCIPIDEHGNIIGSEIIVYETMLKPVGFMIIRNPVNAPVVNNIDLSVLDVIIKATEDESIGITDNHIQRLKSLREKLSFYVQSTEV